MLPQSLQEIRCIVRPGKPQTDEEFGAQVSKVMTSKSGTFGGYPVSLQDSSNAWEAPRIPGREEDA